MSHISRRNFCKDTILTAASAAAVGSMLSAVHADPPTTRPAMPMIQLGTLDVSRLVLGANPFFGFTHGNPQASGKEMKE